MSFGEKLWRAVQAVPGVALGEAFWYLLFAGGLWLTFWVALRRPLRRRRILARVPGWRQMSWEVLYSLRSMFIFGLMGGFLSFAIASGWTRMYWRVERHGWGWFALSIVLMVLIHDTYFYWTHRLMHHRRLFRLVHRTHHRSTSPSPWAAYAFSPYEAAIQAGIAPLVLFTLPVHPTAFFLFMIWQISFNVFGHCGYEIFPRWFLRCWLGRLLNTPTHHALHHEAFRANFSLYFNVWDGLLGTNHRDYAERFARATSAPAGPAPSPAPAEQA